MNVVPGINRLPGVLGRDRCGKQFSTLTHIKRRAGPKEYLLMFSMPSPGSSNHHTRGKYMPLGFFKLLTTYRRAADQAVERIVLAHRNHRFKMPHLHWRDAWPSILEGGIETKGGDDDEVRLGSELADRHSVVPALMAGDHEFADGQTDKAVYITLGLWVAGVCCAYALFDALIGWMERNARRVEAEPYGA